MNTDYIPEQGIKEGNIPSWLGSLIKDWLTPLALGGLVFGIVLMALGVEMGDNSLIIFMSLFGLFILDILLLSFGVGYKRRWVVDRVNENGEYDMETPRKYTQIQNNWYQKFYSRFRKRRVLKTFAFCDGVVLINTADGSVFEKPLKDIKFTYTTERCSNGERLFTFVVNDIDGGQELKFVKVPFLLEDKEWEDILNILARSNFKRPKGSGIMKKSASVALNLMQGEIVDAIGSLADACNNSFSMIEGMKLYD